MRMLLLAAVYRLFVRRQVRRGHRHGCTRVVEHVHSSRTAVRIMVQRGGRGLVHLFDQLLVMRVVMVVMLLLLVMMMLLKRNGRRWRRGIRTVRATFYCFHRGRRTPVVRNVMATVTHDCRYGYQRWWRRWLLWQNQCSCAGQGRAAGGFNLSCTKI